MNPFPYKRVVVIGTTSSGKSTLAKQLADLFALEFIELDALFWEPNWKEAETPVFRERVDRVVQAQGWVAAGNYSKVRDILWSRADAVIWLDYPFHIVFWRLLTRTLHRSITREELWNGNRENFANQLKLWSEDSLIHWFFKSYWRRKREIPILLANPEFQHLTSLHFQHPHQTEKWIEKLRTKITDQDSK